MITPRLQCILNYSHSRVIADIGTDHAHIPIALINEGRAGHVIASDVNEGPLSIARSNIDAAGLSDKIETRLGSGISVLKPGEADQIIIAGMGGELIQKIIEDDKPAALASELLLQPMNSQYELRKYLINNGFCITDEDIAVEGFKVYNIIKAVKGHSEPFERDIYYHIPPYLKQHKLYRPLYEKKQREFKRVIRGLEKSKDTDHEKLKIYKFWLDELNLLQEDHR